MSRIASINRAGYDDYPVLLKEINDPPKNLFYLGELTAAHFTTVAVVGTRKASQTGIKIAEDFSNNLAALGITIISGLAMGIDAAAHRGALKAGGKTIAVLGNGLGKIYPAQNESLAREILKSDGAIISEYSENEPPYKSNFIRRNRIVSGLSSAVLVIEAPSKSGAISTAGFAAEQGRQIFVIPGPINHPNYAGSHSLIRDGATLVTSVKDIIEDLGMNKLSFTDSHKKGGVHLSEEENLIISTLKETASRLNVDKIVELTKLQPQLVGETLTMLVLKQKITDNNGFYEL
ncbi:MAG: DNA-protecting protein DprA [Candidatus Colwellbacteria bacterium]|nr:DNA-protecting protein DprA [Candidatus Colwellbacteria bacterium]